VSARWSGTLRLTAWAWFAALCACVTLGPLVDANRFLVVGAFAGLLVSATGVAGRLGHVPPPLVVLAQLVVLLEWATLAYASPAALLGFIPTPDSLAVFGDLARQAIETSNANVPPAPADEGVAACLAVIVALVVLVVDAMAVTWRRPALVGLVFLGIYMAPVSLLAGNVPLLAFVPGALGYVFLLAAEQRDRLSHWGRQITHAGTLLAGRDQSGPTVTSLVSAGRRVGFGAVGLAVVIPLLVPTLPRTFLGDGPLTADGGTGGSGGSDGSVEVDNPMLDLRRNLEGQSDSVLVRVTTAEPDPGYLRLAALDEFTGDSWLPSERTEDSTLPIDQVPLTPGLGPEVRRDLVRYDVQVTSDLDSPWLPTVYPVTAVSASGDWRISSVHLDVTADGDFESIQGISYDFTAGDVQPTREQLEAAGAPSSSAEPFLALPDDVPDVILEAAADVTADETTAIDKALALQEWFRVGGDFEYSLEPRDGDGMETIEAFVTDERVGYCEQFAAAMALMARTQGIPARVAVGFLRPDRVGEDQYEYSGVDMHSWPELYFEGVGWLRFEPTPGDRTGASAPTYAAQSDSGPGAGQNPDETTTTGPTAEAPRATRDVAPAAAGGSDGGGVDGSMLAIGLGLVAAVALLGTPRLARSIVRRRRWAQAEGGDLEPVWRELRDGAVDLGIGFDDRATLRGAGRQLRPRIDGDQAAVDALNRLVLEVERARFARGATLSPHAAGARREDVETVLAALASRRTRGQLLRATWLPVSLVPSGARRSGAPHATYGRDGSVVQVEGTATR